jgi:hypothetical protein
MTPFTPFRCPDQVWAEFLSWWRLRWPSRPAPRHLHNLRALTGLSDEFLKRRLPKNDSRSVASKI